MSTMNGSQLRHAMDQVHMKENFEEEIIMNVRTQMADGTYRRNSFKRNMVSAAACLLVIGTVSIPAYAGYLGFRSAITSDKVMARMQEVPEAEVQNIYNMVQYEQRSLHADQFNREYTKEEENRRIKNSVTLTEGAEQLIERLGAIMKFKRTSKAIRILTGILTLCIIFGAAFIGVYPGAGAADAIRSTNIDNPLPTQSDDLPVMEKLDFRGTTYYLLFNEIQLRAIGMGEYGMEQNYMQQADIQLSTNEWIPIGTWDNPFTGTFNGNGFEIAGLTMTDPDAKIIGLFGVAENAHIYNVTMRDYDIMNAGRNVSEKSVGAVFAVGQGSRSYDNFVYAPMVKNMEKLAADLSADPEETLPEAAVMESAKSYREKKAKPLVKKIVQVMRSVYSAYLDISYKFTKLQAAYNRERRGNERLTNRLEEVLEENRELRIVAADFGRIKAVVGSEQVNAVINRAKQQEQIEAEQKRVARRKDRGAR